MARALSCGDLAGYLDCLNLSRVNHYALHPSCDSDTLRRYFDALSPHIRGGKTCGAGGGGFIMVHTKSNHRKQAIQLAESLGGQVWHLKIDGAGLRTWNEPASSPEEIRSILARIKQIMPEPLT
jgi:galactokinase/mevalonate kinase-like predicted kinase